MTFVFYIYFCQINRRNYTRAGTHRHTSSAPMMIVAINVGYSEKCGEKYRNHKFCTVIIKENFL